MKTKLCVAISMACFFSPVLAAEYSQDITFAVVDNNRLFQAGEAGRFQQHLHQYLRCVNEGVERSKDEKSCQGYSLALKDGELVPDLRVGDPLLEYRTRYDKRNMAYEAGYAHDPLRKIRFRLVGGAMTRATETRALCSWRLVDKHGVELGMKEKQECFDGQFSVSLTEADPGGWLEFQGRVQAKLFDQGGKPVGEFEAPVYSRDYLIVAMGDSFTSGEGNPERNQTDSVPAQWLDYRCHRSVFSYPVIFSQMLALADPRHSVTLLHFACSGARSTVGILQPYGGALNRSQMNAAWSEFDGWFSKSGAFPEAWRKYGTGPEGADKNEDKLLPQLVQFEQHVKAPGKRPRTADLLLMSAGVNDIGLVPLINALGTNDYLAGEIDKDPTLVRPDKTERENCGLDEQEPEGDKAIKLDDANRLKLSFACLQHRLKAIADKLNASKLVSGPVYLMEYHNPLLDKDEKGKDAICGSKPEHAQALDGLLSEYWESVQWVVGDVFGYDGNLNAAELRFAHDKIYKRLISTLDKSADAIKWEFVQSKGDEHYRGFCVAKKSWYHKYKASKARQGLLPDDDYVSTGTLHPNTFGQYYSAMRAMIAAANNRVFGEHNLSSIQEDQLAHHKTTKVNPDGTYGFAWYIWNEDRPIENIERKYHNYLWTDRCSAHCVSKEEKAQ